MSEYFLIKLIALLNECYCIWKCIKSSPCEKRSNGKANKCDKKELMFEPRAYMRFKYEIDGEKCWKFFGVWLQHVNERDRNKKSNQMRWQQAATATAAATRQIKIKKTNVFMRLGFILIGFFIRNLVKRNVKNGLKVQTHKKEHVKKMHHQLYISAAQYI